EAGGGGGEGAAGERRGGEEGGGEAHPGGGGAAGGLSCRGMGEPRKRNAKERGEAGIHRTGRRRDRPAHRRRHRRRHVAATRARLRGSGLVHARKLRAAPTLVP